MILMLTFLAVVGVIALILIAYHLHMLRYDVDGVYRRLGRLGDLEDCASDAATALERIASTNEENTAIMRRDRSEEGIQESFDRIKRVMVDQ